MNGSRSGQLHSRKGRGREDDISIPFPPFPTIRPIPLPPYLALTLAYALEEVREVYQ